MNNSLNISNPKISAFIICNNEKQHIRRCLNSVRWCDEIVAVVDNKSNDGTYEICCELADKVLRKEWEGFVKQKAFGLKECQGEWVLNLDADEEVSPELREEIINSINKNTPGINGYFLLRVVFHLDRWWRTGGWFPEYRLRLCRKSATTWTGRDPHERAEVEGKTQRLKGELRHYTYEDLADQTRTLNRFSSSAAETMASRGDRASIGRMIIHPLVRFTKFFLIKGGWREGTAGFIVAMMESYYVFLKYAKLWEIRKVKEKRDL